MRSTEVLFCPQQFTFHASIDFVTIGTPGKRELPPLLGRPVWGVAANYKELTIHDLQPDDVARLVRVFPSAPVLGMEVTLDLVPPSDLPPDERTRVLNECFVYVARHLYPYDAPHMREAKTVSYVPQFRKVMPFNFRTPAPDEELLYGMRDDGPAQVKVYRKCRDNGVDYASGARSVRIEVRLKQQLCAELGLSVLREIAGFRFRRFLMPYFRMARGVVACKKRSERPILQLVNERIARLRENDAKAAWAKNGVQGVRVEAGLRYRRHTVLNQRIGKALQRLEQRFGRRELVRQDLIEARPAPVLARLSSKSLSDRITIRYPFPHRVSPDS